MKAFLQKKGVSLSPHQYFITALRYTALGLFSSLLTGLIIKTLGEKLGIPSFVEMGSFAMDPKIVGSAIGVAVASGLGAPSLVLFSSVFVGAYAGQAGGPAASYIAVLAAVELGKISFKSTRVDIIVVPVTVFVAGFLVARLVGVPINRLMMSLGGIINWSTEQRPLVMSVLVATIMGLALTAPISSAAISFMLGLKGLAAGAAVIGCSAQMVGFAAASFRENGMGGLLSQGIGTSMLQIGNIIKNPRILIPPTLAGIIAAPPGVALFRMTNNPAGAGMGTSGLVGQFMAFESMGFSPRTLTLVLVFHIALPAAVSLLTAAYMRKKGWIRPGDMRLVFD